jgi:hypothetical protein
VITGGGSLSKGSIQGASPLSHPVNAIEVMTSILAIEVLTLCVISLPFP